MKKPLDTRIDAALGREICLRDGGIRALLTGRVEKVGSTYVLSVGVGRPGSWRDFGQPERRRSCRQSDGGSGSTLIGSCARDLRRGTPTRPEERRTVGEGYDSSLAHSSCTRKPIR